MARGWWAGLLFKEEIFGHFHQPHLHSIPTVRGMDIPPQAVLLYKGKWTAACDNILLDSLLSRQSEPQCSNPLFPSWSLVRIAASEIKSIGGVSFTATEVDTRVGVLHSRYTTFKKVVKFPGARWDYPSKSVIASDQVWLQIFEVWSSVSPTNLRVYGFHHQLPYCVL